MLALPAPAFADGDPASDILLQVDVYYGVGIDLRSKPAAQLPAMLAEARRQGFDMKVALISDMTDLGIATFMWEQPQEYATYLGNEIANVYKGHLLVVMPNGFGYYHFDKSGVTERRRLRGLADPRRPERFLASAERAVQRIAAGEGMRLTLPDVEPLPGGVTQPKSHFVPDDAVIPPLPSATPSVDAAQAESGSSSTLLFLAPVGAGVLVAIGFILVGRRRSRGLEKSS